MPVGPPIPIRPVFQTPSFGIRVAIYPSSDPTFDLELARSGASSAGSTYQTIARMGVINGHGVPQYVDRTANDGFKRFYKARSVRDGWTPSTYTAVASATPGILQESNFPTPALSGLGVPMTMWVSSAAAIKVGSHGTTGQVIKFLTFNPSAFQPSSNGGKWLFTGVKFTYAPTNTGTLRAFAPLAFPPGVTLTSVSITYRRLSTKCGIIMTLSKVTSSAGG